MFKKSVLTLLFMAAVSQAAVQDLLPQLQSGDLEVQTQARLDLLAACSEASAPSSTEEERKAVCLEMCKILKSDYPVEEVIRPFIHNLERIGGEESVPTLVELMKHENKHVRDDARRALVLNPSFDAAKALAIQFRKWKDHTPEMVAGIINGLGERKQDGASKWISRSLENPTDEVFFASVKALAALNEDEGVEALMERRGQEKGFRQQLIDSALLSTGRADVYTAFLAKGYPGEVRAAAMTALILSGQNVNLTKVMSTGDPALQLGVIEAAKQGRNAQVYDAVAGYLESLVPYNQVKAISALETSRDSKYGVLVLPLLTSGDDAVRKTAADALGTIGSKEAVTALIAEGSKDAQRALGRLDAEGVDEQVEQCAKSGNETDVRVFAIEVLAGRGRTDLIPTFFEYGQDEDRKVSAAALEAIGSMGAIAQLEPMLGLMIKHEKSPVSREALIASVQLIRRSVDQEKAVQILVEKIEGASPRSQSNLLKVLAETGSPAALKPLADACRSSDEQLQKTAVKALGGWEDLNGIETMLEVAVDESTSLTSHVTLMRGVSRIFAAENPRRLKGHKKQLKKAVDVCRRSEEQEALQITLDKIE